MPKYLQWMAHLLQVSTDTLGGYAMGEKVAILSAGKFGTALAAALSRVGNDVMLHTPEAMVLQTIRQTQRNTMYLKGIPLGNKIVATSDLSEALAGADVAFLAIPAQHTDQFFTQNRKAIGPNKILVSTCKGLLEQGLSVSQLAESLLENVRPCVLSGITFATDVAQDVPISSMSVAAKDISVARRVASLFDGLKLTTYVSSDFRGVEFGGAAKNVYAIAMGIVDSFVKHRLKGALGARCSILTESITEFVSLGRAYGGKLHSLLGPAGIGDIIACATHRSRNYKFGHSFADLELAPGTDEDPAGGATVEEGYIACQAVYRLSRNYHELETPVLEMVHSIIVDRRPVADEVTRLLESKYGMHECQENGPLSAW